MSSRIETTVRGEPVREEERGDDGAPLAGRVGRARPPRRGPAHPFALSRLLGGGGPLGKVLTVRRPLVYRAVERLAHDGLIERERTEPGEAGPQTDHLPHHPARPEPPRRLAGRTRCPHPGPAPRIPAEGHPARPGEADRPTLIDAQRAALADSFDGIGGGPCGRRRSRSLATPQCQRGACLPGRTRREGVSPKPKVTAPSGGKGAAGPDGLLLLEESEEGGSLDVL